MATLKPVQTDKYGLAKVSDGMYVNPDYATPESKAAMLRNANPQGFSPYTIKDANGKDVRINPINEAAGFSGYGFSGEGGVSNANSIQGLNLKVPTTITSSALSSNEAPIQIPQIPFSTQADRITGRTNAILQNDDLEQKAEQQRLEQQAKLQSTEQKQQSILQKIGLVKQEETQKGNEEFGLDPLKEKRKNAVKGMRESQIRQQEEFAAVEKESMLTDVQKSQRRSAIRQKYALEQNQLQLDYDFSNMDIVAAQATIDDRIKILTEPMYAELDITKNVYNQVAQSLSKAEDRIWNIAINNRENAIAEKNKISEFVKDAIKTYGFKIPAEAISQASSAKTIGEAAQSLAPYLGTPKSATSTTGSFSGTEYANDLDAIIGATLSTIPTKFGQQTFNEQISRTRNDADKISLVAAQVLKGQPAEFKNDFRNQAVGISMIDKAIAELDKGTQTGAIQAGKQYAANFLGKDYDPALAKIEGYITSAIQPYRNSVTGAAWGEQEDNEYASLFGSTKYSPTELRQRLLQTKELLKSKSAEGLNAFVNPLGTYDNQFNTGTLAPQTQTENPEDIFDSVISGGSAESSSWIKNAWNSLFN